MEVLDHAKNAFQSFFGSVSIRTRTMSGSNQFACHLITTEQHGSKLAIGVRPAIKNLDSIIVDHRNYFCKTSLKTRLN